MVQEFLAIHEYDVASLARVQRLPYESASRSRNLASRDDEDVIEEHPSVGLGVEDGVPHGHLRLGQNLGRVVGGALAGGVDLVSLDLSTEVDPVAGGKLILHPEVLPELQRLFAVACRRHPLESKPLEQRDDQSLGKVMLAGGVQERRNPLSLGDLLWRERP